MSNHDENLTWRSRFGHLEEDDVVSLDNEAMDTDNNLQDNDDWIIKAGIRFPPVAGDNGPVTAGSFVTVVMTENGSPSDVTTTRYGPDNGNTDSVSETVSGVVNESNPIGLVTFSEGENGMNGQQLQYRMANYGRCNNPTFPLPNPITPFDVIIKNITKNNKSCTCSVRATDTVDHLMDLVKNCTDIPLDQQRLVYAGQNLQPGHTLREYGIKMNSEITVLLRLRGG